MPGAGTKQQHISQQHHKPEHAKAGVPDSSSTVIATTPIDITPAVTGLLAAAEEPHKSPDEVLSDFARLCVDLPATGALIAVRDLGGIRCTVSFGNAPAVGARLPADSALASECIDTGEVALCEDTEIDPRIPTRVARFLGFRSAAAVPVLAQGSVVGFIEVFCFEPFAISPDVVSGFQRVAKSFAMQMILEAASGGQPVVGGPLDNPMVLPRLIAEERPESCVPKAKTAESIKPASIEPESMAPESIAPKSITPAAAATPAAGGIAPPVSSALKTSQELEIPKPPPAKPARAASPAKRRNRAMLPRSTPPPTPSKQASSLAQLPSDRPIPARVYVIAAAILLALSLLLLFLFRGATPRNDTPEALFWRGAPHATFDELFTPKPASAQCSGGPYIPFILTPAPARKKDPDPARHRFDVRELTKS